MRLRERVKRVLPGFVLGPLQALKNQLAVPPAEEIVLHDYRMVPESGTKPRLTLVIPSIAPEKTFGGFVTGFDIFLEIGKRAGADLRIILDEIGPVPKGHIVDSRARHLGIDPATIEILPRMAETPEIAVRSSDVFLAYTWWAALNLQGLIGQQCRHFGGARKPLLYIIQDYEPYFYPFSSTNMLARQAFASEPPCWGIFNSGELYAFFSALGHKLERSFVFEPQLNTALRPILNEAPRKKERRLLVYGRPGVGRNCFPAVEKGIREWVRRYPEFSNWEIVSAGLSHRPLPLGGGRVLKSAGKLALQQYGEMLLTSAAGLSLMASPHPSYPPLEMAHFGLWTVTNSYTAKDLSRSHENIISIDSIDPVTIADALARACGNYEQDPDSGWRGKSLRPSYLETGSFGFLDAIVAELKAQIWP